MSTDFEFDEFFEQGERLSDISELTSFAMMEEANGRPTEALQLFRWATELIDDYGGTDHLAELRLDVQEAIHRLRLVSAPEPSSAGWPSRTPSGEHRNAA